MFEKDILNFAVKLYNKTQVLEPPILLNMKSYTDVCSSSFTTNFVNFIPRVFLPFQH